MKCMAVGLGMWLALGGAWAQQVWRCEVDGQVRYTDRPCEKTSQPLPGRLLQLDPADSPASDAARVAQAAPAASVASDLPASAPVPAACGGDGAMSSQPARPAPCLQDAGRPADAGSAVSAQAAAPQPRRAARGRADRPWQRPAPQGLLQTDFVQRGYVPRRQNPASTPTP